MYNVVLMGSERAILAAHEYLADVEERLESEIETVHAEYVREIQKLVSGATTTAGRSSGSPRRSRNNQESTTEQRSSTSHTSHRSPGADTSSSPAPSSPENHTSACQMPRRTAPRHAPTGTVTMNNGSVNIKPTHDLLTSNSTLLNGRAREFVPGSQMVPQFCDQHVVGGPTNTGGRGTLGVATTMLSRPLCARTSVEDGVASSSLQSFPQTGGPGAVGIPPTVGHRAQNPGMKKSEIHEVKKMFLLKGLSAERGCSLNAIVQALLSVPVLVGGKFLRYAINTRFSVEGAK